MTNFPAAVERKAALIRKLSHGSYHSVAFAQLIAGSSSAGCKHGS